MRRGLARLIAPTRPFVLLDLALRHFFASGAGRQGAAHPLPTATGCLGHPLRGGQRVDSAQSPRFVASQQRHTFPLLTSARRRPGRGDGDEPVRNPRGNERTSKPWMARRRGVSRVQELPHGCGQGGPHALAKHTDVLRPGDITTDYAASAPAVHGDHSRTASEQRRSRCA